MCQDDTVMEGNMLDLDANPDLKDFVAHSLYEMRCRRVEFFEGAGLAVPNAHSENFGNFLMDAGALLHLKRLGEIGFAIDAGSDRPAWECALLELVALANCGAEAPLILAEFGNMTARILHWAVDHFAWAAPVELGCEIALDGELDDAAIRRLADLLWANRHSPAQSHGAPHD